jgi:hypothetical protein
MFSNNVLTMARAEVIITSPATIEKEYVIQQNKMPIEGGL